jgi:hypothetical protein
MPPPPPPQFGWAGTISVVEVVWAITATGVPAIVVYAVVQLAVLLVNAIRCFLHLTPSTPHINHLAPSMPNINHSIPFLETSTSIA